jgi:hypothetical protein
MAIEWLLVGTALGAGGMYLACQSGKVARRNPTEPTWDDFDRNILITFGRDTYFVNLLGKDVGKGRRNYSTPQAALRVATRLASKHGIPSVYLWDFDDTVTLFDAQGNQLQTWEDYEAPSSNPTPGQQAEIKVLEPCECEACRDPRKRWFHCRGAQTGERLIAEYEGPGIEGGPFPTREFIRWVEREHPGKVYVYFG